MCCYANRSPTPGNSSEWTGDGALVEVRLIERSHPDSPFKAVGILGDRLWLAGTGTRPEDALYDYWSRLSLRPGVPDSWSVHPLGETYFWIKWRATNR